MLKVRTFLDKAQNFLEPHTQEIVSILYQIKKAKKSMRLMIQEELLNFQIQLELQKNNKRVTSKIEQLGYRRWYIHQQRQRID